ncbi:arginine N-succinyltransferase [Marinibactrum halimedae]|uniref:Arginine N-succinyltransferase n=1 Tax=Marinibactrum halimedae TaxID=1444977 RepID=A0AA37WNP8_9GAMM|nr:arginine N-succinyltransferase [Marinibactrum halimedae]MCD9460183.1 arginine N-succinyltransferase [Marinibactrum halimedae]GLS26346.1 arginine N-succinyltransferase [Marinibactrum halimedae]
MIIRNARMSDLEALLKLSASVPGGMTSMPFDEEAWKRKLTLAEESLGYCPSEEKEAIYFLVLEDPDTQEVVGTAGVHAGVGRKRPFYNYKLSKHVKASEVLNITVASNLLNLVNDLTGETEFTSLFIKPEYRRDKLGQFLSRSRFMLINDFPERFGDIVFAEIRGWLDHEGNSPFWDNVGKKFFNVPYHKADFISAVSGSQFISDLMPRFPVYLELLPEEAVNVIGKPHRDSVAAMKLLEKEGFRYQGVVDIFDAGPVVECNRRYIESMNKARYVTVHEIVEDQASVKTYTKELALSGQSQTCTHSIMSNGVLNDYRLVMDHLSWNDEYQAVICSATANALGVVAGDQIQFLATR